MPSGLLPRWRRQASCTGSGRGRGISRWARRGGRQETRQPPRKVVGWSSVVAKEQIAAVLRLQGHKAGAERAPLLSKGRKPADVRRKKKGMASRHYCTQA